MSPSRRSYRETSTPRRRGPAKVALATFVVLVLIAGVLTGVLVLSPNLANLIPGATGMALYDWAAGARAWLDGLVSDGGALAGLGSLVEPFLSQIGLNLPTILLALGLIVLAVVCIRVLVVTSRPSERDVQDELESMGAEGRRRGQSAYWPYEGRPGQRPAPITYDSEASAAGSDPYGSGSFDPGSQVSVASDPETDFPFGAISATGDAWPLAGAGSGQDARAGYVPEDTSGLPGPEPNGNAAGFNSPAGDGVSYAPDAGFAAGAGSEPAFAADPEFSPESYAELPPSRPSRPSRPRSESAPFLTQPEVIPATAPGEGEAPSAGGLQQPAPVADHPLSRPYRSPRPPASEALEGPGDDIAAGQAYQPRSAPGVLEFPDEQPGGMPAVTPDEFATEEFGPAAFETPAPIFQRPAGGRPGGLPDEGSGYGAFGQTREVSTDRFGNTVPAPAVRRPVAAPAATVAARPGLGEGLRKFTLTGFILLALGAGSAYGLTLPPVTTFLSAGPFGTYILISAAALVGMTVSYWFISGPMKPMTVRVSGGARGAAGRGVDAGPLPGGFRSQAAAAAEPQTGRFRQQPISGPIGLVGPSGRPVRSIAPAPIPGRAALEGGLEAPDAIDWSTLPKPSIFLPWTQTQTSVGLDIGTAWTKVVQVGFSKEGLEIINLALCPTPEGVLSEEGITDPELLGDTLKEVLQGRNIIQRQVTTALGGQGVIIRHVQFPAMSEAELREVIRWEAEHHIPIPPPEAVVDFTVMPGQGDADERGNRQMRVMLVGAQKQVVEDQITAMRRAKLVPKGVDAEALACYRVVRTAGHSVDDPARYAQAIIDFGHTSTKLGIYLKGALEMSRTLNIGGGTFTSVIADKLRVPEVEAETLKRQYGVHPDGGRVLQALTPSFQDLMFEIRRSFEFFASRHFGQSVRQVYLIGGGARMPGIVNTLTRYLNSALGERLPEGAACRVDIVDPLSAVPLSPRLQGNIDLVGPEFVTSLGLALGDEEEVPYEG